MLVHPADFKSVGSQRKLVAVGSIPSRLRHSFYPAESTSLQLVKRISDRGKYNCAPRSFSSWIRLSGGITKYFLSPIAGPNGAGKSTLAPTLLKNEFGKEYAGGHHVSEIVIQRRYRRGIRTFFDIYRPWQTHGHSTIIKQQLPMRESSAMALERIKSGNRLSAVVTI